MKKILLIVLAGLMLIGCGIADDIQEGAEAAYFDGQRDAMNGEWKIQRLKNGCYKWIKSPWKDQQAPIYNINFKCEKK